MQESNEQTETGPQVPGEEKDSQEPTHRGSWRAEDILQLCPKSLRGRYRNMAEMAVAGSRRAAIKLHCIDCCAWTYVEAKRCAIRSCALWQANQRIFHGRGTT